MKTKKIVLSIIFSSLMSLSIYGHSGRTDSYGGHYNRTTGVYHDHGHSDSHIPWALFIIVGVIIIAVVKKSSGRNGK